MNGLTGYSDSGEGMANMAYPIWAYATFLRRARRGRQRFSVKTAHRKSAEPRSPSRLLPYRIYWFLTPNANGSTLSQQLKLRSFQFCNGTAHGGAGSWADASFAETEVRTWPLQRSKLRRSFCGRRRLKETNGTNRDGRRDCEGMNSAGSSVCL